MRFLQRKSVEPTARVVCDDWLEWLRLSAFSPLTIKGYRRTSSAHSNSEASTREHSGWSGG